MEGITPSVRVGGHRRCKERPRALLCVMPVCAHRGHRRGDSMVAYGEVLHDACNLWRGLLRGCVWGQRPLSAASSTPPGSCLRLSCGGCPRQGLLPLSTAVFSARSHLTRSSPQWLRVVCGGMCSTGVQVGVALAGLRCASGLAVGRPVAHQGERCMLLPDLGSCICSALENAQPPM